MEKKKRQKRATHHVDPIEIKEAVGTNNEKTKLSFSMRLNDLLDKNETAQEELAAKTELSMSSISTYRNGKAEPKITAFNKIANSLNVTADYLLGNTDISSPSLQMQSACEYTGLSEQAIEAINELNKDSSKAILNTLLEDGIARDLICSFEEFILYTSTGKLNFSYTSDKSRSIPIDPKIIAEWFLDMELARAVEKIKETLLDKYASLYSNRGLL